MKYVILIIIVSVFSRQIKAQPSDNIDTLITGSYELSGFNMSAELHLNKDLTFNHKISVYSCDGYGDIEEFQGKYSFVNNLIIFKSIIYKKKELQDDLVLKTDSFSYSSVKHDFRDTLNIILWENRIYLLANEKLSLWGYKSNSDFQEFVNDINSGYFVQANSGSYWSKKCSLNSTKSLEYLLPAPWNEMLLNEIIEARTIKVEPYISNDEYETIKSIVTIDKGSIHGVKIGMKFYADIKDNCECDIEVFEVKESFSKGYADICGLDDCQVQTKLSTYLKRGN